jgi:phage baseplate assembly protein gpV
MKIRSFALAIFATISLTACGSGNVTTVQPSATATPAAQASASAAPATTASPTAAPANPLDELKVELENGTNTVAVKATQVSTTSASTYRPGASTDIATQYSYLTKVGDTVFIALKKGDNTAQTVTPEKQSNMSKEASSMANVFQRLYKDGGNIVEYDQKDWKIAYMVVKNLQRLNYMAGKGFIQNSDGINLGSYEVVMSGDPFRDTNHSATVTFKANQDMEVNINTAPRVVKAGQTVTDTIESFKFLDKPEISISVPSEKTTVLKPLDNPKTGEVLPPVKKMVFQRVGLDDVRYLVERNMLEAAKK